MILINRRDIATQVKTIGSELSRFQEKTSNVFGLDYFDSEAEWKSYLTRFDLLDLPRIEASEFEKTLTLSSGNLDNYTNKLSISISELLEEIGIEELIIISLEKIDFFGNRANEYEPLVNAYKKLEKVVKGNTYNKAFEITLNELEGFIEIFFWTMRCDPSGPEFIFFYDKGERLVFNICKYGNVHITEFGQERMKNIKSFTKNWTEIKREACHEFTTNGNLEGRKLKL